MPIFGIKFLHPFGPLDAANPRPPFFDLGEIAIERASCFLGLVFRLDGIALAAIKLVALRHFRRARTWEVTGMLMNARSIARERKS